MDFLGGVVRNSNIEPHLCPLTSGIQGPLMAHLLLSIESAGRRGGEAVVVEAGQQNP